MTFSTCKIAPEHFLRGYCACGHDLFLFPEPETAARGAAGHDHEIRLVALAGQFVQRSAAPEFDVVGMGTDGQDIHF
jgi:hypothetical protein